MRTSNLSALRTRLEKAAAGLTYTSEQDDAFRFFYLPGSFPAHPFTARGFVELLGVSQQFTDDHDVPIGELVEEQALRGFFPRARDLAAGDGTSVTDPAVVSEVQRFRKLERLLRASLRDVRVFRVGKVEVRCYIAGHDARGDICGLVTTAIET